MLRVFGAMGTELRVEVVAADRATALRASEAAVRAIEAAEARLSTWRTDTELARLNALGVGETTELSTELASELTAAWACAARTDGAFDPTVAPLSEAWGLRLGGRLPDDSSLDAARSRVGVDGLILDGRRAFKQRDVAIDEGGFGKGAGLDRAVAAAVSAGASELTLDFGGQISHMGPGRWIALADPRDRGKPLLDVRLDGRALATSGNSERGVDLDGRWRGHLLDPREGAPARDLGSVSVLAPSALRADCLSTGLYVLGPEAALRYAAATPDVDVIVLATGGDGVSVTTSANVATRAPAISQRLRRQE